MVSLAPERCKYYMCTIYHEIRYRAPNKFSCCCDIADRTSYDVWYSYRPMSGILVVSKSILFTYLQFKTEVFFWCLLAFSRSLCFVVKRYIVRQVSKEVNRKCRVRNTTVPGTVLQLLHRTWEPQCTESQTDRPSDRETTSSCQEQIILRAVRSA